MTYDDLADDRSLSLSAVGEALCALDGEIARLEQEACTYYQRIAYVTEKQRICQAAIKKLLMAANNGAYPARAPALIIPEFHGLA